jgi:hypothetical protein
MVILTTEAGFGGSEKKFIRLYHIFPPINEKTSEF